MGKTEMQQKTINYMRDKLTGIRDAVSARDDLKVEIEKASKVVCAHCRKPIYYLKETRDGSLQFAPLETGHPVRNDMQCPRCGKTICAYLDNRPMIKTDRGWI